MSAGLEGNDSSIDSFSPPQVLVTGASGYIATHIVQQLLLGGKVKVRGTVRSLKNESKAAPLMKLVPDAKYPLELVEADLLNEESWIQAVNGCDYVYHTASPFPFDVPRDENEIIKPAVEGTLNVLKACTAAGSVKRVVLTSSATAVAGGFSIPREKPYNEEDWADEAICTAYEKSKVRAERAAWDFVKELDANKKFELATITPTFVIGPPLTPSSAESSSIDAIKKAFTKEVPILIEMSIPIADVRDVAAAHIAAMETPVAAGQRYVVDCGKNLWWKELADIMTEEFGEQGYKPPSFVMPKIGVFFLKAFNSTLRRVYPMIGKDVRFSNEKMISQLGIEPRDPKTSVIDSCYGLIEIGAVEKKPGYRGPHAKEDKSKESAEGGKEGQGEEEQEQGREGQGGGGEEEQGEKGHEEEQGGEGGGEQGEKGREEEQGGEGRGEQGEKGHEEEQGGEGRGEQGEKGHEEEQGGEGGGEQGEKGHEEEQGGEGGGEQGEKGHEEEQGGEGGGEQGEKGQEEEQGGDGGGEQGEMGQEEGQGGEGGGEADQTD